MCAVSKHFVLAALVAIAAMSIDSAPGLADDAKESDRIAAAIGRMRDEVSTLKVTIERDGEPVLAQLKTDPILRYTDPERDFPDATMWVWSVDGRPVVFSKLERFSENSKSYWQYCVTNVHESRVQVRWANGTRWRSTAAALQFKPLPETSPPKETAPLRLAQLRVAARQFRATSTNHEGQTEQLRPLSQPLLRYSNVEQSLSDGAVFAYAANGTNPDGLLLIQVRLPNTSTTPVWEYGCLGVTADAIAFELTGENVFRHPGAKTQGDHGFWYWVVFPDP